MNYLEESSLLVVHRIVPILALLSQHNKLQMLITLIELAPQEFTITELHEKNRYIDRKSSALALTHLHENGVVKKRIKPTRIANKHLVLWSLSDSREAVIAKEIAAALLNYENLANAVK